MKIFIDGSAGTTGLRLAERLARREDVDILRLPEEARKDPARRKDALNSCDAAFLCLPDAAAREAVALLESESVTILDTSTAHRVAPGWVYGFPELSEAQRSAIRPGAHIAVPGCHASGFIALVQPLVAAGLLPKESLISCFCITGYSGGGKSMIAQYQDEGRDRALDAPRQYALGQTHKHLPEMCAHSGIATAPLFSPVVSDFYSGMVMTVPLFRSQLKPGFGPQDLRDCYREKYRGPVVRYVDAADEGGFLSAGVKSGWDGMEITVAGNEERILLLARYDNLGKGASGAALQCMNLVFGLDETLGLNL